MFVQVRPRTFIEQNILQPRFAKGGRIRPQLLLQRQIPAPDLLKENVVYHAAGLNQFNECITISR